MLIITIIERNRGGKTDKFSLNFAFSLDSVGISSDIIAIFLFPGSNGSWGFVRSGVTSRCPEDKQSLTLKLLNT